MRLLWVTADIDADPATLWRLLTDVDVWPDWGPSLRGATLDGGTFASGATGTVDTAVGVTLPFQITEVVDGRSWTWDVAGIPATHHSVEPLAGGRCRVGFGVPWPLGPYLAVCSLALRRLRTLAVEDPS